MHVRSSYPHEKTSIIVNLSSHNLTDSEVEVLKLGHSFVFKQGNFDAIKTGRQLKRVIYNRPTISNIVDDILKSRPILALSKKQIQILSNLQDNEKIIITQADKGDTWVLLNKADYIWECERQINDTSVYQPLYKSCIKQTENSIRFILKKMLKLHILSKETFEKLVPKTNKVRERIFYTLPKIHKPKSSWYLQNTIPPGRPIVGNTNSEDTEISKYIDRFLQPIVQKQPHILSNSDALIHKLSEIKVPDSCILFTLDVSSLYTNIPLLRGLDIVGEFFKKYPDPHRPPDNFLLKLLSLSLFKNDFRFRKNLYRQVKGVAMGKQYSPSFANLYMCKWEEVVLSKLPDPKPLIWLRYIDDIFGIWPGSLKELTHFIELANGVDKNIQITCNSSLSDIQFLDLIIFKTRNHTLSTMVSLKSTSSLRLVHPKSVHPHHTKTGVIFSQILRFYKNCSFQKDFSYQLKFLFSSLMDQGYTLTKLREIKSRVFHHINLYTNENDEFLKGFYPCVKQCKICQTHGTVETSLPFAGGVKIILQNLSCSSRNIIYVIRCKKCSKLYIGETKQTLKCRITQHISSIKRKIPTPVSEHFNGEGHSIKDFTFFGLLNNISWSDSKIKIIETHWINKLHTLNPNGLNKDTNKNSIRYITLPFKGSNSVPMSLRQYLNKNVKTCFTTGSSLKVYFNHKHRTASEGQIDGLTPNISMYTQC